MEVCCKESCRNEIDLQARNAIKGCCILHMCDMFTGPTMRVMMVMMIMIIMIMMIMVIMMMCHC